MGCWRCLSRIIARIWIPSWGRHVDVEDHQLDVVLHVDVQCPDPIGRDRHLIAPRLQEISHELAAGGIVVDDQDPPAFRHQSMPVWTWAASLRASSTTSFTIWGSHCRPAPLCRMTN